MPPPRPLHVPCPACRLLDFYVLHSEGDSQTRIVCTACGEPLLELQWAPAQPPDPAIII